MGFAEPAAAAALRAHGNIDAAVEALLCPDSESWADVVARPGTAEDAKAAQRVERAAEGEWGDEGGERGDASLDPELALKAKAKGQPAK